ncbi:MAG: NAD(P)-dependent oxidoreductase [Myxococcota bacterium]
MRMLVADELARAPLDGLALLGVEIRHEPSLTAGALPGAVGEVDILVVRDTVVSAATVEAAKELNLIIHADRGADVVDVAAASQHGVYVAHCPSPRVPAVAELTLGMLLALDRGLVSADPGERDVGAARGVFGRRLGIAGMGRVGQRVAATAAAMGMRVMAWSRGLTPRRAERLGVTRADSLEALAAGVDVLSLHLPLVPSTRHVVDATVLRALPRGAVLLNAAHPALVDPEALTRVAVARELRVGLDMSPAPDTPAPELSPARLCAVRSAAGATLQAEDAIATEVSRIVRAFLSEGDVPNVINVMGNTAARYALILRSRDEVGVLANVLAVIKRHGLNITEVKNHVFEGASAACTKLNISGRPTDRCLAEICAFDEVFHVDVVPLPNLA